MKKNDMLTLFPELSYLHGRLCQRDRNDDHQRLHQLPADLDFLPVLIFEIEPFNLKIGKQEH
jgi:hypothetical protein